MRDFSNHHEIINQPNYNKLRLKMLNGEPSPGCINCYQMEEHGAESIRISKNQMLGQLLTMDDIKENTNPDGSLKDFKMRFWDVRFNNICNLSCRMCGPEWSHTWAQEEGVRSNESYVLTAHDTDNFKEMLDKYGPLDDLYDIFFAGGEVLFQKEHWEMLDHLIEIDRTDVMIMYVTNLTKLDYNGSKLLDYIPKFKNVTFTVSIDGIGSLAEYIRWGTNWETVVNNLRAVSKLENVNLRVNFTTTFYNLLGLPDTIDFLYSNGYLNNSDDMDIFVAQQPHNHVGAIPSEMKSSIRSSLLESKYYNMFKDKIDAVIDSMMHTTYEFPKDYIKKIDQRRGCNILDVIPELESYMS